MKEHNIDASQKTVGRLASKIAILLQGKDSVSYEPRLVGDNVVIVTNASKIKFSGKKWTQKLYRHHTGYIGHLREKTAKQVFEQDPTLILKKAVMGMLPKNKLRSKRMKNLKIYA